MQADSAIAYDGSTGRATMIPNRFRLAARYSASGLSVICTFELESGACNK
jgi:hypothetical protein